jgi:hypothetical protein
MKQEVINAGIIDLDTHKILGKMPILQGELTADMQLHHYFNLPSFVPKCNFRQLRESKLKPSTLSFLIIVIDQMGRDGRLKDGLRFDSRPTNYKTMAKFYDMKKSTLADHMKELLDKGIIRKHRNRAFFINPLYAYKFSRMKIPNIVAEVFPEHFRYRVTSSISKH